MTCPQFESHIPEYLDDQLPPVDRGAVERHLAACAACSSLAADLQRLDILLSRSCQPNGVSPGFRARLWQRIESEAGLTTAVARTECKRRAEAELARQMARIRLGAFQVARWLDLAGLAVTLGATGAAMGKVASLALETAAPPAVGVFGSQSPALAIVGLTLLVLGAGAGLWKSARRTWLAV